MTHPEGTQEDAELDPGSSTDEATPEIDEEEWKEAAAADYQTRLREFDNVESVPVVSLPVKSSQLEESDLEVESPGEGSS